MNPLDLLGPWKYAVYAAVAAALIGGATYGAHHYNDGLREEGRQEVRAEMQAKALAESQAKAKESLRRVEAQARNEDAKDAELAAAKAAAARADAAADRVREQSVTAARQWAERLADSPTREDLAAAGAAIGVCTDVLGRADRRASILARFADASRAAGLKCERDYDALTGR